jgi:hypothetical protein
VEPSFPAQIEAHLSAIAECCLEAGRPQWAEHITLVLGHPEDLQHAVIFGYQDLKELLLIVLMVQLHQRLGYETGFPSREG